MSGRLLLGTQGWNYPDWVGGFYPEGTRQPDFLELYAQAFPSVEVDSTFYAVPPAKTVRGWRQRTPAEFVFALKFPQELTHERRLRHGRDLVDEFLAAARELGDKLGPLLLQLGPDFDPAERDALEAFLPTLPHDLRVAVEVRHPRWARPEHLRGLLSLLAEHGRALALSDGKWFPRETVLELVDRPTADFHYVRWMGPNRDLTVFSHEVMDRAEELGAWAGALRGVLARGMDVFGYANNHFTGHSPATMRRLQRLLGQTPVEPSRLGEQISLF
ncbi:MAG TPA: DUF72 domain-containing protein [Longimicrobiaceae bacterium]|nr:DUF72 domain-containing protein [Longimicrobiaceae bacterium]